MHRPLGHAPKVLAENRRRYEHLVETVQHYAGQGDVERTLRAATGAANFAWEVPVGLLSDVRLERTVVHAVRGSGVVSLDGDRRAGRVLHVLSEAYAVGGHTRLAWRWMSRDERTTDVVLTNQWGPVPDRLVEAVRAAGGDLSDLRSTTPGLLDRAHVLRQHMDRADLVVLHVHPYDAVVLAAVNLPGARPPVIYENHADHAFWLGVAGADLVCDLRPQARALDVGLRGVSDERIAVLPMPVDALPSPSGGTLRRELGIRPDAVVALTVSADWKMAASWGRGMHGVVDRVLRWCPTLSVVLVGATPSPEWARVQKRHPGRVFPVGRVPDPAPYFALADIYLESYPSRATTSALEAAVLGLPVVALADVPEDDIVNIFQAGSPGLADIPCAGTADQFAVAVRRLALDPELRRRTGAEAQAAVLAVHDGPAWRSGLESLYSQARSLPVVDVDSLAESPTDDRYGAMMLSAVAPAPVSPDPQALMAPLGDLFDSTMQADLFAASRRHMGTSLTVRAATGWELQPAWTTRLLEIAGAQSRLAVSLPFATGDDPHGTRSAACVVELLTGIGQTPETCGDITIDAVAPADAVLRVSDELPFLPQALDWLEGLVSSPCWEAPREDAPSGGPDERPAAVPAPRGAVAAEHLVPAVPDVSSVLH